MNHFRTLVSLITLTTLLAACTGISPGDTDGATSSANPAVDQSDIIRIAEPQSNTVVMSPLTVKGEARGPWYAEGSFPVRIVDSAGTQIGLGIAEAQGEWMTMELVPFSATVEFTTTDTHGSLILEKDNPSGEPENASSVTVPVQFKNS